MTECCEALLPIHLHKLTAFYHAQSCKHFFRYLPFKGVDFKWGNKVHTALIKGSYKSISRCSSGFQAIDLPGLYALEESVEPCLFEEPRGLTPLSQQAPWFISVPGGSQQVHWSHPGCHFWQRRLENESEVVGPGSLKSLNVHTTCY